RCRCSLVRDMSARVRRSRHNLPEMAPTDEYIISTDRARVDVDLVHNFLTHCYWAAGIRREVVARSIENSLCFGVYRGAEQVGFARIITDFATYAYLGDVFILEAHRGRGLGK